MTDPMICPSHIDCGECGASLALEWEPPFAGVSLGHARCSCGAGVVSIYSQVGLSADDVDCLLLALQDLENLGCGSLIA